MSHFFEGFQYRPRTEQNQRFTDPGNDWLDIEKGRTSFPEHTQFRIKPVTTYTISSGSNVTKITDEAEAKSAVSNLVSNRVSFSMAVSRETPAFTLSKLQYRQKDAVNTDWRPANISAPTSFTYATEFRIRPDHYHVVDTFDSVVHGSVAFHDIEELAAYIDNRIRTNGLDFSVKKVKYGI